MKTAVKFGAPWYLRYLSKSSSLIKRPNFRRDDIVYMIYVLVILTALWSHHNSHRASLCLVLPACEAAELCHPRRGASGDMVVNLSSSWNPTLSPPSSTTVRKFVSVAVGCCVRNVDCIAGAAEY